MKFEVMRPIRSLPCWHGARWSAWFRECSRACSFHLEDFVLSILPARQGKAHFMPGENVAVRLVVSDICHIPAFLDAALHTCAAGEFSARSLRLFAVVDLISSEYIWLNGALTGQEPLPFTERKFEPQINAIEGLREFSLCLTGPLRVPLPPWLERGPGDMGKFCQPRHFADPRLLAHILSRVRQIASSTGGMGPGPATDFSQLYWDDMRYNPQRKIALGGICGTLGCKGRPEHEMARRLVLGQYLGAGKNGRFGLGFWRIPELAQVTGGDP